MKVIRHDIRLRKEFKISFMGDWHLGVSACDKTYIQNAIKVIVSERDHHVILMGDLGDYITHRDPRYEQGVTDPEIPVRKPTISWQMKEIETLLTPIKDRIICILNGNHEQKIVKQHEINPNALIADNLGVEFLGYSGFVKLGVTKGTHRHTLDIYCHHGRGGGGTHGGKMNALERLTNNYDADVFAMGHVHALGHHVKSVLGVSGGRKPQLINKNKLYLLTGTALKTFAANGETSYSEVAGYAPSVIGHMEMSIKEVNDRLVTSAVERQAVRYASSNKS